MLCDSIGHTLSGLSSNLPGTVQSVARGERAALLSLAQNLDHLAQVVFVTDNYNVYNIYYQGQRAVRTLLIVICTN